MRILVTRPEPVLQEICAALEDLQHEVIVSPLLEVENLPLPTLDVGGTQALIVTSRNAVRAIARTRQLKQLRAIRVYAVGIATADEARDIGFTDVIAGPGDACALCQMIVQSADPRLGRLIHLAGETVSFDMVSALTRAGFTATTVGVYRARPAVALTKIANEALRSGRLDAVILMSPRSARTFSAIVAADDLRKAAQNLIYICISRPTADALDDLQPRQIQVAENPSLEGVISLANRISPQSVD